MTLSAQALGHALNRFDVCPYCGQDAATIHARQVGCHRAQPPRTMTSGVIGSLYPPDADPGDQNDA